MTSVFVHESLETRNSFDEILSDLKSSGYTDVLNMNYEIDANKLYEVYVASAAFYNFVYRNQNDPSMLDFTIESLRYVGFKYTENQLIKKSISEKKGEIQEEEFNLDGFFDYEGQEDFGKTFSGKIHQDGTLEFIRPPESLEEMEQEVLRLEKHTAENVRQNQEAVGRKFKELQEELEQKKKKLGKE
jgi:hypothetical protein